MTIPLSLATSSMTHDFHLNNSCVERVQSAPMEPLEGLMGSVSEHVRSTRRSVRNSVTGGKRMSLVGTAGERRLSRQSLKFSPKNFVTKWADDLKKHYKMGSLLGTGAYGNVYSCTCLQSGAERAVKVVPKNVEEEQNEAVIREFEVLKELDHPNVLKNYALFETGTHFYIVTDWIRGGELYDLLEKEFTEEEVKVLIKSLLSCMNYCHQSNVVHRDLKPENILLEADQDFSRIKVIDFGLAQFFHGDTEGSFTDQAGSSYYMSPQVIEGNYNCKCDIWSIGVIAFVCLGGYAPFAGTDEVETAQMILDADAIYFDDPSWDNISDSALDFIEYLMTIDENNRPTAAEALQHEWLQVEYAGKRMSLEDNSDAAGTARSSLQSLRAFHAADSKLKQCTYSLIASQILRKEDKEQVDRMFQMLDVDCDGKIGLKDMQAIYNDQFGVDLSEDDVNAMIYEVNLSGTGAITYSEFVIASLNEKGLVSEHNLELAFHMMDRSGTGYLTVEDLIAVVGVNEDMATYVSVKIIAPADRDGDGKISLEDFKAYFAASGVIDIAPTASIGKARRGSRRRSTVRKSFRASVLLAKDLEEEFGDVAISTVNEEPSFRSLLSMFEGQIKDNSATVPSMFQTEACG